MPITTSRIRSRLVAGCAGRARPRQGLRSEQHQLPVVADLVGEQLPATTAAPSVSAAGTGSLVIVGRIVTLDEPAVAEALLIEDGRVTAVGTRDEVLASAGGDVPVVDIGRTSPTPDSSTLTLTGSVTASTTEWVRRPKPWTWP